MASPVDAYGRPIATPRVFDATPYVCYDEDGNRGRRDTVASLFGCLGDVAPARLKLTNGVLRRMNVGLERASCFGIGSGICASTMSTTMPRDLEGAISKEEWREIFVDGLADVSATTFSRGSCAPSTTYICGIMLTALICLPYFSSRSASMWRMYDQALREWTERANARLRPRGMRVKPQSNCWVWRNPGGGGKQRHIECWISIALDEEESAELDAEPHLFGDIADYSWYGGPRETDFITHPTF